MGKRGNIVTELSSIVVTLLFNQAALISDYWLLYSHSLLPARVPARWLTLAMSVSSAAPHYHVPRSSNDSRSGDD